MRIWQTLLLLLLLSSSAVLAQNVDPQAAADTPKKFYQSLSAKDYAGCWALLTEGSKSKLSSKIGEDAKLEASAVREMFDRNASELQNGFWEALRTQSQPELIVQGTFTYVGPKDGALIVRVSDPGGKAEDAMDLIVKDENGYKYGLTETMNY